MLEAVANKGWWHLEIEDDGPPLADNWFFCTTMDGAAVCSGYHVIDSHPAIDLMWGAFPWGQIQLMGYDRVATHGNMYWDIEQMRQRMGGKIKASYVRELLEVYRKHISEDGAVLFGDLRCTYQHPVVVEQLATVFPSCKLVAFVRSPFDCASSRFDWVKKNSEGASDMEIASNLLVMESKSLARVCHASVNHQLYMVSYEAIARSPREVFVGLFDYLGLDVEDCIMDYVCDYCKDYGEHVGTWRDNDSLLALSDVEDGAFLLPGDVDWQLLDGSSDKSLGTAHSTLQCLKHRKGHAPNA